MEVHQGETRRGAGFLVPLGLLRPLQKSMPLPEPGTMPHIPHLAWSAHGQGRSALGVGAAQGIGLSWAGIAQRITRGLLGIAVFPSIWPTQSAHRHDRHAGVTTSAGRKAGLGREVEGTGDPPDRRRRMAGDQHRSSGVPPSVRIRTGRRPAAHRALPLRHVGPSRRALGSAPLLRAHPLRRRDD